MVRRIELTAILLGMIASTHAAKANDQNNFTLDPGQPTIAGAYQISANWSQLTRGKYSSHGPDLMGCFQESR